MADLKLVYAAPIEETAHNELELPKDKWDSKYPKIYKSWYDNWATLFTYFKYPEAVRRLIYTTNAIEGFDRKLRKVAKSKAVFPTDDSLLKMLYLAMMDITQKWIGHRQDWGQIHSRLEIYFEERFSFRNLQNRFLRKELLTYHKIPQIQTHETLFFMITHCDVFSSIQNKLLNTLIIRNVRKMSNDPFH